MPATMQSVPTHVPQSIGHRSGVSQRKLSQTPSPHGVGPARVSPPLLSLHEMTATATPTSTKAHARRTIHPFYQTPNCPAIPTAPRPQGSGPASAPPPTVRVRCSSDPFAAPPLAAGQRWLIIMML